MHSPVLTIGFTHACTMLLPCPFLPAKQAINRTCLIGFVLIRALINERGNTPVCYAIPTIEELLEERSQMQSIPVS